MRSTICILLLCVPTSLFAQAPPCADSVSTLLTFDPYKPSHAAIIRNYGGTVLAQAPLDALRRLDPYVPSEAALLRQMGGAIPVWPYAAYAAHPNVWVPPSPGGSPCDPQSAATAVEVNDATAAGLTTLNDVLEVLERRGPAPSVPSSSVRSERRHTVSVEHDGRVWASDGPAVRFDETAFVRIAEHAGSPVFRRAGGEDLVIYIRTTPGMVAPFRVVQ